MAKKKQRLLKETRQLALIGCCLLLFGLAVTTSVYYRYKYSNARDITRSYPLKTSKPGEILVDDRFAFSFNSVRADDKDIPGFWELTKGDQFVIVNMSFTNRSTEDFHLSPILMMHATDSEGALRGVTSAPSIKDSLGGVVRPGETVRGEVGFALPKSVTSSTFIFDPKLPDAHLIKVNYTL